MMKSEVGVKGVIKTYIFTLMFFLLWSCLTVSYKNVLLCVFTILIAVLLLGALVWNHKRIVCLMPFWTEINILISSIVAKGSIYKAFNPSESPKRTFLTIYGYSVERSNLVLFIITISWMMTYVFLFVRGKGYDKFLGLTAKIKKLIKNNWELIVLIILVIILSYDPNWYQFKWDGYLYYLSIYDNSLTQMSELGLYGHLSLGFSTIVMLLIYCLGDAGIALQMGNIFVLIIGTVYFYRIVKHVFNNRTRLFCFLATTVFAFSPYMVGMVNYYSLDYYMLCLFPVFVYYTITSNYYIATIASFFFCFTKEPAVIIMAGYCIGMALIDLFQKRNVFTEAKYYLFALPLLCWLGLLIMLGPWVGGNHSVGINIDYIVDKLKVMYVLNFHWLFLLLVVFGTIFIVSLRKQRVDTNIYIILPIIMGQLFFTVFSCFFITVTHPRYNDVTAFSLVFLFVFVMSYLDERITTFCMSCMSILLLISCFYTLNPITRAVFPNIHCGSTTMISTSDNVGDATIYNKQMLWQEKGISEAIGDAIDSDSIIVIPLLKNTTNACDGMSDFISMTSDIQTDIDFWDSSRELRLPVCTKKSAGFEKLIIAKDYDLSKEYMAHKVSIIYSEHEADEGIEEVLSQIEVENTVSYEYRGWKINRVTGMVK